MATGYTDVSVGTVHVAPEVQAPVGAVVATAEVMLPLVENVPAFTSVAAGLILVNVVAETVTFQPAPLPVASSTTELWCAVVAATSCWLRPLPVPAQVRAIGESRFRLPPVKVSVPVSVHAVPATTGVPGHAAAWAVPAPSSTQAPTPPVSSTQAPATGPARLLVIRSRCHIMMPSLPGAVVTISILMITLSSNAWIACLPATVGNHAGA